MIRVALGICLAVTALHPAAAQHVPGFKPVDPRLRTQPASAPQTQPRFDGSPLQRPSFIAPTAEEAPAASGPSALDLMKLCFEGSASGAITNPTCIGYLAGFIGAIRIAAGATQAFPICLPETPLRNETIVNDVSAYLEQNEASLTKSARSVVFLVLSDKFPCSSG